MIINIRLFNNRFLKLHQRSVTPGKRPVANLVSTVLFSGIKNWVACVQDRGKWKNFVEKAKTFNH